MKREPMASAALHEAGYDPESQVLELAFRSGRVYQYSKVPPSVYEWLLKARSKGTYIARILKDYPYREVTPPSSGRDLVGSLEASLAPESTEETNDRAE